MIFFFFSKSATFVSERGNPQKEWGRNQECLCCPKIPILEDIVSALDTESKMQVHFDLRKASILSLI